MSFDAVTRESFLRRYRQGAALLRQAWNEVPAGARTWRPGEGKWSAHEVVIHCADSETYAAIRIRLLLGEAEPLVVGYDETAWAKRFDYHASDPELALHLVETARAHTAAMLDRLPEEAWGRMGRHTQSGPYGTDDWLRSYGEHLEIHAAQIRRNLAAWQNR
ncbi:MAG: DinB family protein [Geothrix sp.]|uniref:DinB family protein n=1 Tax=Geothrix sp. TaxID=1962974 RepID=UPI001799CCB9|nr:DinB family protein [Geothrix sp.]NWJ40382.1 DinB family protein [Geothrix sp.]WIL21613.1 MAG: DinB family protein [Geothrix sp.]